MNERKPFDSELCRSLLTKATLNMYDSTWRQWLLHCDLYAIEPLPVNPLDYEAWLDSELDNTGKSSFKMRIGVAKSAHKYNNLPMIDFTSKVTIMRQIIHKRGVWEKQAAPLRLDDILTICESPKITTRTQAMVSLMFDAVLRSNDCLHLTWDNIVLEERKGVIRPYVRVFKTKGKFNPVGEKRSISTRTVNLLTQYYEYLTEGYQKPVKDKIFPFSRSSLVEQFRWIKKDLNINMTSHSMRVGAAVEMHEAAIGEVHIMKSGGWDSIHSLRRYTKNASSYNDGMAQLFSKKRVAKTLTEAPRFIKHFGEHNES